MSWKEDQDAADVTLSKDGLRLEKPFDGNGEHRILGGILTDRCVCASIPMLLDGAAFTHRDFDSRAMNQMEAFRILASADRQIILHELSSGEETADIEELSREVAARRHRISPERISGMKVDRARARLVHSHLPKLQEKGVLDIDWNEKEISLVTDDEVDHLFDAAGEVDSWPPDDLLTHPSRSE